MAVTCSDAELVQQALAGSQAAYRELVSRYATRAVNFAARMVRDRALAEDLAQEAFLRMFERLASYDQQRRFITWFFQILHNIVIDHLRRRAPPTIPLDQLQEAGHFAFPAAPGILPDAAAEQVALARAVDQALGLLRPEYVEAIILFYREELSIQEIAEAMGVPPGTVKTYLYRARKELGTALAAKGWSPAPQQRS